MMEELCDAFDVIDNDDKIRATLITGSGRAFCAGADLSGGENTFVKEFDTPEEYPQDYNKDAGGILTLRMYKSRLIHSECQNSTSIFIIILRILFWCIKFFNKGVFSS